MNNEEKFRKYFWLFNKWMYLTNHRVRVVSHQMIADRKIAVYGMGAIGRRLIEQLEADGVRLEYAVDRKGDSYFAPFKVYSPEERLPFADVMIVSQIYDYDDIVSAFLDGANKDNMYFFQGHDDVSNREGLIQVISLETLIDDLWKKEWNFNDSGF